MAIEDLEYARRKTGAAIIIIFGLLIAFVFTPLMVLASSRDTVGALFTLLFGWVIGFALMIYGSYVWKKVTHVVWTKQAIREMMDKDHLAEEDFRRRYNAISTSNNTRNNRNCSTCGGNIDEGDALYCNECGTQLNATPLKQTCNNCGLPVNNDDIFCSECGTKITMTENKFKCKNCHYESKINFKFCPECGKSKRGELE